MIKLYHAPRARSVRVYWLLEELQVPFDVEDLEFTPEALKSPEYLKVHPLGRVPAIQDDELTMFESGAIVEYILEKYGEGRLVPPPGTAQKGLFLQWVHFAEATALPPLADIAQHTLFKPEGERVDSVVEDGRRRVNEILGVFEPALARKPYLLGEDFSAADIMVGYALTLVKWFGLLTDTHPNTLAYLQRLEERPAYKKAIA
jgi:glutathione S-transferase